MRLRRVGCLHFQRAPVWKTSDPSLSGTTGMRTGTEFLWLFTKTAQDAPVIDVGEEWAFLVWGLGGKGQTFVHSSKSLC